MGAVCQKIERHKHVVYKYSEEAKCCIYFVSVYQFNLRPFNLTGKTNANWFCGSDKSKGQKDQKTSAM